VLAAGDGRERGVEVTAGHGDPGCRDRVTTTVGPALGTVRT
jgi:hypothetical protein